MSQRFSTMLKKYLLWMEVHNYAPSTIETHDAYLGYFIKWCDERELEYPHEVTRNILEQYQRSVYRHKTAQGKPLKVSSQQARLTPLKTFFKWLSKNNHILFNPAAEMELPRTGFRLPQKVLSVSEVETVLAGCDLAEPVGIRDRAILETLYSTGIRRAELANLGLYDIDMNRGTVTVRQGKGRKDRVVPIGERAIAWVDLYSHEVRPKWCNELHEGPLFLTVKGTPMTLVTLTWVAQRYLRKAGIEKGSCHLFRHSMATLMLENGADVRYVQEMLGHERLDTTKVYTHVSIRKLKEIHAKTHPARLNRRDP